MRRDSPEKRLLALAEKGPTEKFCSLLAALPRPLDHSLLFSALCRALVWNQQEKVRLLLDAGANPLRTNEEGDQPLMHAAMSGSGSLMALMLSRGCDVNHRNINHWTAMHTAADAGNLEGLCVLLDAGGDVDCRDARNVSPLHNAIHDTGAPVIPLSRTATVQWLLRQGLDPDRADNTGMTPLMYAALEACAESVSLLLAAGARLDRRDEPGRSVLMHALYHGTDYGLHERYTRPRLEGEDRAVPVIRLLLAAGADPEGEEALACARRWRWSGTVTLLREAAGKGISARPKIPSGRDGDAG